MSKKITKNVLTTRRGFFTLDDDEPTCDRAEECPIVAALEEKRMADAKSMEGAIAKLKVAVTQLAEDLAEIAGVEANVLEFIPAPSIGFNRDLFKGANDRRQ